MKGCRRPLQSNSLGALEADEMEMLPVRMRSRCKIRDVGIRRTGR
jgi:hypothetical protein